MKGIKKLLFFMLLIFPTVVFATSGESFMGLGGLLLMEIFVTIHMSLFVLSPIAKLFDPDNSKKIFKKLFIGRIIILFIGNFIFPLIAIIDFFLVFVGAFILVPVLSIIKKKNSSGEMINTSLNQTIPTVFTSGTIATYNNGQAIVDNSPIVEMDHTYAIGEQIILKDLIKKEIVNHGEDVNKLVTVSINNKKNILLFVFGLFTLFCVTMYFFNISLFTCLICEALAIFIYNSLSKRLNIVNILAKEAIKNPNEDISNLITNIKLEKHKGAINGQFKFIIVILVAVIIPSIIFFNPRILYKKSGNEYIVFKYTKGITYKSEVTIPSTYKDKPITTIGQGAFKNSDVEKINLSDGLKSIKTKAFYGCKSITKIEIPSTVTEIRGSAFENCTNLITVKLNEGLESIRGAAFKNCTNLINIELPNSLTYLGGSAFSYCSSLTEMTIPKGITEINGQTFEYCTSLRQINLHDDIISIHGEVFIGCTSLNNVVLPPKITEVRGNTFEGCTALTSIVIPEGVTRIGGHAFYGCTNLNSVSIPSTIREIGSSAFRQCYALKNVKIPYGTVVNERAFKESPTYIEWYDN